MISAVWMGDPANEGSETLYTPYSSRALDRLKIAMKLIILLQKPWCDEQTIKLINLDHVLQLASSW
jgi:hypothetical protein